MDVNENITLMEEVDTRVREQKAAGGGDANRYAMPEGTVLDERYRILRVIGQGGFGITYEAVHIHNGNHVAIKEYFCRDFCGRDTTHTGTNGCNVRVLDDTQSAQFRADLDRFMKEARTLHDFALEKAIVTVIDYFEANDTAYIVMEYLDGTTLRDQIRNEGCWGMEKVVRTFGPVMEAMENVHSAGVIHRDISPDNLMCMPDGTLRLLDFGAARKFDNKQTTHSVIYKAYYSAPEQRDEKGVLGSWTDVYGLCSTMYYCLTGKEPEDVLTRLLYDDMERPSDMGANILPQAEKTLLKGLELDREARVKDMGTLRAELERVYPRISEDEKMRGRARRKRRKRIAAITAAAIVLCAAILAFVFRTRIRFQFIDTQQTVLNGEDMTPEEFEDGSARVKKRIEALVGSDEFLWEEHDRKIRFTVPADVYGDHDPDSYILTGISRRMVVRLNVRDRKTVDENGETVMKYRFVDVLHQEEDIEDLKETEDGLVLVFSETGKKKLGSVLNTPDLQAVLIWDEYDEATGETQSMYSYKECLVTGDGESILMPDIEESDTVLPFALMRELLLHDPLPAAFDTQSAWRTRWEDPGSTLLPGKNQCNVNEIPGPAISVRYSSSSSDEPGDETGYRASILSFQAILKNRLDSLEIPYAVGVNLNDEYEYVVRVPLESVYYEELETLGRSQWIQLGSDRMYAIGLYSSKLEIRRDDGDTFELALVTESDYNLDEIKSALETMEKQGKKEVYLYFDDLEVAAADMESAKKSLAENKEILFTKWLLPEHARMTSDTEHFARYISACIIEGPQDGFFMQETELSDERGKISYFDERLPEQACKSRAQQLVEKWDSESGGQADPELNYRAEDRYLSLTYYNCNLDDPAAALRRFMDLYEKENLGSGGISYIYIDLYDAEKGGDYSAHIDFYLKAEFDKDAMLIGDYCTVYSYAEDPAKWADLPDRYNTYMEETPFWKEKIAADREGPVFTFME